MEFKVLIYIVIGIIWLFSKLLSAKGKQKEGKSVLPESWTKPFEDQIETIKTEVRERKKIKHQEKGKNVRSSVITNSEKTNNIEGGLKAKNNLEKDEIMVSQVQILEEIDELGRMRWLMNFLTKLEMVKLTGSVQW